MFPEAMDHRFRATGAASAHGSTSAHSPIQRSPGTVSKWLSRLNKWVSSSRQLSAILRSLLGIACPAAAGSD